MIALIRTLLCRWGLHVACEHVPRRPLDLDPELEHIRRTHARARALLRELEATPRPRGPRAAPHHHRRPHQ